MSWIKYERHYRYNPLVGKLRTRNIIERSAEIVIYSMVLVVFAIAAAVVAILDWLFGQGPYYRPYS